jgi:CheY-like chemotaxis protein
MMSKKKQLPHVLLVEDDMAQAEALREAIGSAGAEVEVATNGTDALEMVHRSRVDVIFLDLGLPDIDGTEVARRIRNDPALRSVRLLALSAHVMPEDREKTMQAGFDEHIAKPPSIEVLERELAQVSPKGG